MLIRISQPLLAVALVAGASRLPSDPFVGKWKVDPVRSTILDEFKVELAGTNRYILAFAPDQIDTIVADGTDQPALSGTTFSITVKGPNAWTVVRKLKGRTLLKADWTLSADGKSLNDAFTQYLPSGLTLFGSPMPDGSTLVMPYVYDRTAGTSGFLGTWDSPSAKAKTGMEMVVQPFDGDALSFKRSDETTDKKFTLDGADHPDANGAVYSARRVNERRLEVTYKTKGKTTGTLVAELSPDLKTLTTTDQLVGQSRPRTILVFDRE